ncbi:hypothetical protein A3C23_01860 [Candidatus Roizmanbacteria bacterium RIFCSPHIGHO2_02_FULL_37_13b]|uniref:LTD domain-containing protein n=1 Tax=Candidatus Roizmanbacteria bacterium RIFCSPLOWO2_02_FULL_36_11 TaxID=1802071 RepID=A0A1F7JBK6_9BACT|nr:MAG: hypothetical protein A3C23_01860 [Candidatus Roizmanbacteria bacterium RIFCSPHIGHO2_02_FULL_37_13b]OGK52998.1 MAG: hypothetical protein A3H78_02180 [Candidatus Roizmanbacteria bacterium RIFCSPLOWO2_02_FULL_36_11]
MRIKLLFFFLFIFVCLPPDCYGLIINEIYPSPNNDEVEWVELYNESESNVDLSNYRVTDKTGKELNIESSLVSSKDYILTTSTNVLNNDGDTVILKNISGELIDIATYSGTIEKNQSYCQCPDRDSIWQTDCQTTKKAANNPCINNSPTESPILPSTLNPLPSPISNVYISESYVYPKDDESEWVEIYNDNDYQVKLNDWHLDDILNGGSQLKTFTLSIEPKKYAVIELSSSIFNNDSDEIRLLNYNSDQQDFISYSGVKQGNSIFKKDPTKPEWCFGSPSKGNANEQNCNASQPTLSNTITTLPTSILLSNISSIKLTPITTKTLIKFAGDLTHPKIKSFGKKIKFESQERIINNAKTGNILGVSNNIISNHANIIKALSASSYFISLLNIAYICHRLITK